MSKFLIAFVKLEEFFFKHSLSDQEMIQLLEAMISLSKADVCDPFYIQDATYLRNSLPFKELSLDVEILVYKTCVEFLKIYNK